MVTTLDNHLQIKKDIKQMETIQINNTNTQGYIEIDGELFPIEEGIEYTVPADVAEAMGAIESTQGGEETD